MLRVAVCDDEALFLRELAAGVRQVAARRGLTCQVESFSRSEALLAALQTGDTRFDLILLDIVMEGMDGLELARRIRQGDRAVAIVFITASRDYALEGYRVKALHYLLKPVQEAELEEVIAEVSGSGRQNGALVLRNKEAIHQIPLDTIEYLEYSGRRTLVHTTGGQVSAGITLAQAEKQLPDDTFIRCHQGYILNLGKVHEMRRTEAVMAAGAVVPISRGYAKGVQSVFLRLMQGDW